MTFNYLSDITELEALYSAAMPTSLAKVVDRMTPEYRAWIAASKFCVLSTVGLDGTDGTPRGDDGPVTLELDERTLALPDWAGNNRLDSLRNIVSDPRLSLMFLVPGSANVVRVNGRGRITADDGLRARFQKTGKLPKTVLVIEIVEIYFQCAKAIIRADLWGEVRPEVPTAGEFLKAVTQGREGGAAYDKAYPERAQLQLWERD